MATEELELIGRAVNFGHAVGSAFIFKKRSSVVPEFTISVEQIPQEWERFEKACKIAERQLQECKSDIENGSKFQRGEVFDIQIALLKDSYVLQELKQTLHSSLKNVEVCLQKVVKNCIQKFHESDSLPVRERYLDLQDVSHRLLRILTGTDAFADNYPTGVICIAENLEPSDVVRLKNAKIAGILLESDCATSHAVILAKSLHVPVLIGVQGVCSKIKEGATVEIDSEMGVCWVNKRKVDISVMPTLSLPDKIALDKEDVRFYLSYDGGTSPLLDKPAIAGIGLVRTEMLFFNRENFPDEEEQFAFYKRIVESAHGKPVVLRTLDMGGDKMPESQHLQEQNPFLGLRGIRYSLQHEDIFRHQLLAMLRASAFGHVKILYPMISDVGELIRANQILKTCKQILLDKKVAFDTEIKVGAMLETPSAVLCINDLAQHCDFFSIGTNDLVQYTLAVDRTNPAVAKLYQMTHPAILRSLHLIAQQTNALQKEVLVCGELPNATIPFLMCLSLGYRSFVVYDNYVPHLASLCYKSETSSLKKLATEALKASSADAVAKYYKNYLNEIKKS